MMTAMARTRIPFATAAAWAVSLQVAAVVHVGGSYQRGTLPGECKHGATVLRVHQADGLCHGQAPCRQDQVAAAQGALYKIVAMELVPIFNVWTLAMIDSATANNGLKKTAQELAQELVPELVPLQTSPELRQTHHP